MKRIIVLLILFGFIMSGCSKNDTSDEDASGGKPTETTTEVNPVSEAISKELKTSWDFNDYFYNHTKYPESVKLGNAVSGYYEYSYYENGGALIEKYTGKESSCVIPETLDGYTVFAVAGYSFSWNLFVHNVTLPNSILYIGCEAFKGCLFLRSVLLNDGLTVMDCSALRCCIFLKSIVIPNSVTEFNGGMFTDCWWLKSVKLSENITEIGPSTFWACNKLKTVDLPKSVTTIRYNTFADCDNLETVTLPEGLTNIGKESFAGCPKLKIDSFPNTLETIAFLAFENCKSLGKITIPDSVEKISGNAFSGCKNNVVFSTTKGTYAEAYAREHSISIYYSDTGETWTPNLEYKISQFFRKPEPTTNG
ncbi:MAG: leucine-rich repeat domain-containing protein [Clostridiales bacterium]|jgi:uncharacterized protein YceK|nr:leucine-rich repeat domain-containing protein [Clostridiales bacterium]